MFRQVQQAISQLCKSSTNTAQAAQAVTNLSSEVLGHLQEASFRTPWRFAASRSTTILCVRKDGEVVISGDGMVSQGSEVVKPNVVKVRRIRDNVIGGFAGTTADAFTLFERLEAKLDEHNGQLIRAAVELAKAWRTDKYLRRLEASMIVANGTHCLKITGNGDVLEPHDGVLGIGSGGTYAVAAARALVDIQGLDAMHISKKAMNIAVDICIHSNHNFTFEKVQDPDYKPDTTAAQPSDSTGDAKAEGTSEDTAGKADESTKQEPAGQEGVEEGDSQKEGGGSQGGEHDGKDSSHKQAKAIKKKEPKAGAEPRD